MQKNDVVRRSDMLKTPELPAVLFGAALAAACGGPAAVLHDVLDEAEGRVDFVLEEFEDTADEMDAAAEAELPPCPTEYEPPVLSDPPPFLDVVERPAGVPVPADENEVLSMHRVVCRDSARSLRALPGLRDEALPRLEDFAAYVDALRGFISDDMADEDIERLGGELEAIAAARPAGEDTLQLRYERLHGRLAELSPLVAEMALVVRRPGARVAPGRFLDPDNPEELAESLAPWRLIIENHEKARAFFEVWNDYRRRIYEGPDAEDPEEAAAGWGPPTGVWTGLYVDTSRFSAGTPLRVRVAFEPGGEVVSRYLDSNCGGPLELISASGASGRIMEYNERGCTVPAVVVLERTAEDRMRFRYGRRYAGNLARE